MSTTTDASISITVNGEERSVPDAYPLTSLLQDLEIDPGDATGVAVAINERVVRRQEWTEETLADDDTVEIIQAQQGG
jgi:sulfur carrier protein